MTAGTISHRAHPTQAPTTRPTPHSRAARPNATFTPVGEPPLTAVPAAATSSATPSVMRPSGDRARRGGRIRHRGREGAGRGDGGLRRRSGGPQRDGDADQREHQTGRPPDEEQAAAAADREQPQRHRAPDRRTRRSSPGSARSAPPAAAARPRRTARSRGRRTASAPRTPTAPTSAPRRRRWTDRRPHRPRPGAGCGRRGARPLGRRVGRVGRRQRFLFRLGQAHGSTVRRGRWGHHRGCP